MALMSGVKDVEALVAAAVRGAAGSSRHVMAAVAAAAIRTGFELVQGDGSDAVQVGSEEQLGADLVQDRVDLIRPVLAAQVKVGRMARRNVHSPKHLLDQREIFLGNVAKHCGFELDTKVSEMPLRQLKQMQRGGVRDQAVSGTDVSESTEAAAADSDTPRRRAPSQPEPEKAPSRPGLIEWYDIADTAGVGCQTSEVLSCSIGVVTSKPLRRSHGVQTDDVASHSALTGEDVHDKRLDGKALTSEQELSGVVKGHGQFLGAEPVRVKELGVPNTPVTPLCNVDGYVWPKGCWADFDDEELDIAAGPAQDERMQATSDTLHLTTGMGHVDGVVVNSARNNQRKGPRRRRGKKQGTAQDRKSGGIAITSSEDQLARLRSRAEGFISVPVCEGDACDACELSVQEGSVFHKQMHPKVCHLCAECYEDGQGQRCP